jgi:hypothetical protein
MDMSWNPFASAARPRNAPELPPFAPANLIGLTVAQRREQESNQLLAADSWAWA